MVIFFIFERERTTHRYRAPITITDETEIRVAGIEVSINVHGVDIGFACTFHKVQGLTLDYVVLHLARCSTLRTASVHVGMYEPCHHEA